MVATQIPGCGESQRYDQTGEFAGADYYAAENRDSERNEVVLICIHAVLAKELQCGHRRELWLSRVGISIETTRHNRHWRFASAFPSQGEDCLPHRSGA